MVSGLHGLRMICSLEAVRPGWVTKTNPYSLKINHLRFCDPFEILQAKVKRVFSTGPACPFLRNLNKQSAARVEPTSVTSMYLTEGSYVNVLDKFQDHKVDWWRFT